MSQTAAIKSVTSKGLGARFNLYHYFIFSYKWQLAFAPLGDFAN